MNVLFTGDFQADFNNLDLCEEAWQECIKICIKKGIKLIVFLGDGKQNYNPVDTRVILWWQHAIRTAKDKGITVIWVMGNHDRVGQYTDATNWLPILKRAGAITFSKEGVYNAGTSRLFILPYSSNSVATDRINLLVKKYKPNNKKDILVFHHDVTGAQYNKLGGISDAKLSLRDLHSNRFRYCISGHIHNPQQLGENGYYAGSPFCHDWGEVNQQKRYIIIRDNVLTSSLSSIPGWYDPGVFGFAGAKPTDWRGTRIRLSVSCDASKDYGRDIERARRIAEKRYTGSTVMVVPVFKDTDEPTTSIKFDDTDDRKIRAYVHETCKDRRLSKRVEAYMVEKLGMVSANLRTKAKVKFRYAKGINILPFKKVKTYFDKGINVVQGINEDRVKKSNGSGKTSLLQIIPVSLFGRTFKGQTHDKWSNRWGKGSAEAKVVMKDYKGRELTIIRGRKPVVLRMLIDGKDKSSGMKSTDKDGTQLQIEQFTGFTWQTLANAIYIDRSIADSFLSGTKKQRTELLSRFQNLERFTKALELVKLDEKQFYKKIEHLDNKQADIKGSLQECKESLSDVKYANDVQVKSAHTQYKTSEQALGKFKLKIHKKLRDLEKRSQKVMDKYDLVLKESKDVDEYHTTLRYERDRVLAQVNHYQKLHDNKHCPTCHQKVGKLWIKKKVQELKVEATRLLDTIKKWDRRRVQCKIHIQLLDGKHGLINTKIVKIERHQNMLSAVAKTRKEQWLELLSDTHSSQGLVLKLKNRAKVYRKQRESILTRLNKYKEKEKMYEFALSAFSRDGIPQFLNRQLCPVLNKAADYYAGLFSDREIQLKFIIEEGEFVPVVINSNGGESIDDQSTGERALAGLIASFALREVAPRCNLLILDEPGEGLDSQTARQFARSLQVLKKRFGSIWLTTHNQAILSELSGERVITVVKKNKISKIMED